MATESKTAVGITKDLVDQIDLIVKSKEEAGEVIDGRRPSRNSVVSQLIQSGLSLPQLTFDNTQKQFFFSYLKPSEKEPYKADLAELNLTEQELIDMALTKTGKTLNQLMQEAVIQYAKEQITFAARRKWLEESGVDTPETRLMKAHAELEQDLMEGRVRLRGGRINISAVASRARVNYTTARKWAEQNQPELLD